MAMAAPITSAASPIATRLVASHARSGAGAARVGTSAAVEVIAELVELNGTP